ncbi:hypothetical protein VW23_018380 [Devosia insulae DS-56]|uniref:Uncharacterized protein n=1 Tax=Devosia insulae DS-56 TaxID=1116389 RepID=A0A1E5XR65_9HYPH|nr:hypothetical protein [Devosia insulae]OEO31055.1 hypothetical protein VW23_018380 [Devosia insulae DS-56]
MFAPVTRSSAFAPIRSRCQQHELHEPTSEDIFDIEAEYRLVRVQPPAKEPRGMVRRVADIAAAAGVALLIIGSSVVMLELPHQRGALAGSFADSQQARS